MEQNALEEELGWGSMPVREENGLSVAWKETHPEEEVDENGWPVNSR